MLLDSILDLEFLKLLFISFLSTVLFLAFDAALEGMASFSREPLLKLLFLSFGGLPSVLLNL
jgi:hypothetical protein